MTKKIDETLKKLAEDTSAASSQNSSSTDPPLPGRSGALGDPDCPHCHGVGYIRQDLPIGHPDFGRLQVCSCRQPELQARLQSQLFQLSDLAELADMSFENFVPQGRVGIGDQASNSLQQAYNHARMFAESPSGWLLLQGSYGCGKTHLAAAIANEVTAGGRSALFITAPDLLDSLRHSYSAEAGAFEQRFERIRRTPLLILDDFGTQNATEWAREKLFQILNFRYINHLPTVLTTNLALDEIGGRIRSRLADPELVTQVHILAPDYRQPKEDIGHHELSSLRLHGGQTFGTFSLRKSEGIEQSDLHSLQRAFDTAREYSEEPSGWLVLTGPYGVGKTHLAASIANYRASQGLPVMFVVVPDLLDHLRATFNPKSSTSYDRRFEEVRAAPLLIMDDLGTQAATPWVREKLYQLFNHRYNAQLPTVITTADPLEDIDARLRTRMLDARLCAIHAITTPSYRGRKGNKR
jgi:DNA replication protein DnaC